MPGQRQKASWGSVTSAGLARRVFPLRRLSEGRAAGAEAGSSYCALDIKAWESEKRPGTQGYTKAASG